MDIQLKKSDKGVANLLKNINDAVKSSQHFRSSLSSLINSGMAPTDHSVASNHDHQSKRACSTNSSAKKAGTHVASSSSSSSSQSDCSTRAIQSSSTTLITSTPDHDGYMWRKYGEKKIAKSMFPRSYYRCTYHTELDCKATKQVQQCSSSTEFNDDLPMYKVTYFNQHTCNHGTSTSTGTGTVYTDHSQQILAFSTVNDKYSSVKNQQQQEQQQQQLTFSSAGSSSSALGSSVVNTHQEMLGFESTSFENELISGFDLPYDMDELLSDYTYDIE